MKNHILNIWLLSFCIAVLFSCQKAKEDVDRTPESALLEYPADNSLCVEGSSISSTLSSVTFTWNASVNTDTYKLKIRNLLTGDSLLYTTTKTQLKVELKKGTPYAWKVISTNRYNLSEVSSAIRKFYNAGEGRVSYSPFPAEITSPLRDETVQPVNGRIRLGWKGSDVDNDIVSYTVYFGAASKPELYRDSLAVNFLADIQVIDKTEYYWKVITKDSNGNESDSGLFRFYTR